MGNEKLCNRWVLFSEENDVKRFLPFGDQTITPPDQYILELKMDGNFVEKAKLGENHGNYNFEANLLYLYYKNSYEDKIFAILTFNENELVMLEK